MTKPESSSSVGVLGADETGQPSPAALQAEINSWPPEMGAGERCVSLREIPASDKEESGRSFLRRD